MTFSFTTLSICQATAQTIDFNYDTGMLPSLQKNIARDVVQQGTLPNGVAYALQMMTADDAETIHAVLSAAEEKYRDKKYLLPRSLDDIKKTLRYDAALKEGGFVMGIVLNGDKLAGVVGGEDIDNEKDSGRGVAHKGCPIDKQFCWKMAGIHPDAEGNRLYELVPVIRMAVTMDMFPQKTCILTKTNNKRVKENYGDTLGWELKDVYDLQHDETIPSFLYDETRDHDELLHTYVTCQQDEIKKLARENGDLILRSPVLKEIHARYSFAPASESLVYTPA